MRTLFVAVAVCLFCLAYGNPTVEQVQPAAADPADANSEEHIYGVIDPSGRAKRQFFAGPLVQEVLAPVVVEETVPVVFDTDEDFDSDEV